MTSNQNQKEITLLKENPLVLKSTGELKKDIAFKAGEDTSSTTQHESIFKTILRETIGFGVSAGEALGRLPLEIAEYVTKGDVKAPGATHAKKMPGVLGGLGEYQTLTSRAIQEQEAGAGAVESLLKTAGRTAVEEPLGLAFKPVFLAGGIIAKNLFKKGVEVTVDLIKKDIQNNIKITPKISEDITKTLDNIKINNLPTEQAKREVDNLYSRIFEKPVVPAEFNGTTIKYNKPLNSIDDQLKAIDERLKIARKGSGGYTEREFKNQSFNFSAKQVETINQRYDALGLSRRTIKTFGDIKFVADELGIDEKSVISLQPSVGLAEQLTSKRNLLSSTMDDIISLENKILKGGTKEEIRLLEGELKLAEQLRDDTINFITKQNTELGRAVVANRIMAEKTLDPVFWIRRAQKVAGLEELEPEVRKTIFDLINKKDKLSLSKYISTLDDPIKAEMVTTLWKAGLLTSLRTHELNVLSTALFNELLNVSKLVAAPIDALWSLYSGKRTITFSPSAITKQHIEYVKSIKDAGEYIKTGVYGSDILEKYNVREINYGDNALGTLLNGYTRTVFRTLGAEDLMFKKAAVALSLQEQAELIAKNEGLKGTPYKTRVKSLLESPTNEMQLNAIDFSEYTTFTNKGFASKASNKIQKVLPDLAEREYGKGSVPHQISKLVADGLIPFASTPANVIARIIEFSPLGYLNNLVQILKPTTLNQKKFIESFSKATTGSMMIMLGSYLAEKGILTPNAPENQAEREMFYAENKQPHSIKVGDSWNRIDRMSPGGNLLSLGADLYYLKQEKTGLALFESGVFSGLGTFAQQPVLSGLTSLNDAIRNESKAKSYINNLITSFVPVGIRDVGVSFDPTIKNPEGLKEEMMSKIPILMNKVPDQLTIFGEPAEAPGGRAKLISLFGTRTEKDKEILDELRNIDVTVGMPSTKVYGLDLTNKEYNVYQIWNGNTLKVYLNNLLENEEYKKLPLSKRREIVSNAVSDIRDAAREKTLPTIIRLRYPELKNESDRNLIKFIESTTSLKEYKELEDSKKDQYIINRYNNIQKYLNQ